MVTFSQSEKKRLISLNQRKLHTDLVLFFGFTAVFLPNITGIVLHEWWSLVVMVPLAIHLLLSWKWVIAVTTRFFKRQALQTRVNYLWDWLAAVLFVLTFVTGIIDSQILLPALGIQANSETFWTQFHSTTADIFMFVLIIHLILHRRWITSALRHDKIRSKRHSSHSYRSSNA